MSEFERRFLELVQQRHLPMPELQHAVRLEDTKAYLDFAWPDAMLAAECDGLFDHGTNLRLP